MKDQIKIFLKELKVPSELIEYGADELHELLSTSRHESISVDFMEFAESQLHPIIKTIEPKWNCLDCKHSEVSEKLGLLCPYNDGVISGDGYCDKFKPDTSEPEGVKDETKQELKIRVEKFVSDRGYSNGTNLTIGNLVSLIIHFYELNNVSSKKARDHKIEKVIEARPLESDYRFNNGKCLYMVAYLDHLESWIMELLNTI